MNKDEWKIVIEDQIKFDHDYIPSFQTTIQILSEMLEERDRVYQAYIDTGAQPVVNFTSDRGAINLKQNPLLKQWQEINTLCLSYLRDLGLTAAGLRKLQGQIPKETSSTPTVLDDIRAKIGLSDNTMSQIRGDLQGKSQPEQIMTMIRAKKTQDATTTKTRTKRSVTKNEEED